MKLCPISLFSRLHTGSRSSEFYLILKMISLEAGIYIFNIMCNAAYHFQSSGNAVYVQPILSSTSVPQFIFMHTYLFRGFLVRACSRTFRHVATKKPTTTANNAPETAQRQLIEKCFAWRAIRAMSRMPNGFWCVGGYTTIICVCMSGYERA